MSARVHVLHAGYSRDLTPTCTQADGSSTLILDSGQTILVDTMGPRAAGRLTDLLLQHGIRPQDVNVLIGTHSHPDHIGNLNLFTNARLHVCGFSVYHEDRYTDHLFTEGESLDISPNVTVIPTPGHTLSCVSVVVRNVDGLGTVVVAGDLFEKEEDLRDESLWINAGSEDEESQRNNREKVMQMADYVVPGHGNMFRVPRDALY